MIDEGWRDVAGLKQKGGRPVRSQLNDNEFFCGDTENLTRLIGGAGLGEHVVTSERRAHEEGAITTVKVTEGVRIC